MNIFLNFQEVFFYGAASNISGQRTRGGRITISNTAPLLSFPTRQLESTSFFFIAGTKIKTAVQERIEF
jgi:hypothetical protein